MSAPLVENTGRQGQSVDADTGGEIREYGKLEDISAHSWRRKYIMSKWISMLKKYIKINY